MKLLTEEEQGPMAGEVEAFARREPFSRFLPYLAYDERTDQYHNSDNTIGRLWECRPLTFVSDKASAALASLLRQDYSPETVFQFILYPDDHIDETIERYLKLKVRKDELSQEAARRYAEHLSRGRDGIENLRGIPVRNFRLFVAVKAPVALSNEQVAMIEESLSSAGFGPQRMTPGRLLEWLRRVYNVGVPKNARAYDPSRFIRAQAIKAESPVTVMPGGVMSLGGRLGACLTPKSMPETVGTASGVLDMNRIIGGFEGREDDSTQLLHRFLWTTTVLFKVTSKDVKSKANVMMAQKAGGSIAKTLGRRVGELDWVLDDIERSPYCNVITSMWVFGSDEEDLNKGLARARTLWEKQNFVMQREDHVAQAMLIAAMPFGIYTGGPTYPNINTLDRDFPVSVQAAANLLPVQGDFAGNMAPVMMYVGRKGQLATLDVFDKGVNNYNYLVCAGSGAGKSFQSNFLVANYYGAGSLIRIVDIGYSYDKQCMASKGRFIDVGAEAKKICLNPLMSAIKPKGAAADDAEGDETTAGNIILTMVYSSTGTGNVTETQYSLVKDAIRFARRRDGGLMGIDHVTEFLREYPKHSPDGGLPEAAGLAREMAFNLRDFTSRGRYGSMFNGPPSVNISSDEFVVLEMEQLLNDAELFRVIAMQVINMITQDLYLSDRSQQRFMLFDEAWKYLGAGDVTMNTGLIAGVITEGYRRARKYGGSTGIVTQSPLDLLRFGSAGGVIKSNSAFKFFLESDDYRNAVQQGVLEYQGLLLELAAGVKNNKPKYSEVLFDTPYGAGVGRLCMDPWSYWMYTSAPTEVARFKGLMAQGLTAKQTIDKLSGVAEPQLQVVGGSAAPKVRAA